MLFVGKVNSEHCAGIMRKGEGGRSKSCPRGLELTVDEVGVIPKLTWEQVIRADLRVCEIDGTLV